MLRDQMRWARKMMLQSPQDGLWREFYFDRLVLFGAEISKLKAEREKLLDGTLKKKGELSLPTRKGPTYA